MLLSVAPECGCCMPRLYAAESLQLGSDRASMSAFRKACELNQCGTNAVELAAGRLGPLVSYRPLARKSAKNGNK